jgi:hypothetical protein
VHLGAVEGPGGDDGFAIALDGKDVAREPETELGRHGGGVADRAHREADEHDVRAAVRDQLFEDLLVHVAFELG